MRMRMPLVTLRQITMGYGGPPLLAGADLRIEPGERICLLGRNGAGKTTLLRLIAGELEADDGRIEYAPQVRIARLDQQVPRGLRGTVFDQVAGGLGADGGSAGLSTPGRRYRAGRSGAIGLPCRAPTRRGGCKGTEWRHRNRRTARCPSTRFARQTREVQPNSLYCLYPWERDISLHKSAI